MIEADPKKAVKILLVEDNEGDIRLAQEVLAESRLVSQLDVVRDGVEALAYLRRQGRYAKASRPDIILMDLNLPRMDGRELLTALKNEDGLKRIPVIVLTTSQAEQDVLRTYELHANCFISKPVDLEQFMVVIKAIEDFWFTIVSLPTSRGAG